MYEYYTIICLHWKVIHRKFQTLEKSVVETDVVSVT